MLSPFVGFLIALALVLAVSWVFVRQTPYAVDRTFRVWQFVSASLYSLGHGGNDAVSRSVRFARSFRPDQRFARCARRFFAFQASIGIRAIRALVAWDASRPDGSISPVR